MNGGRRMQPGTRDPKGPYLVVRAPPSSCNTRRLAHFSAYKGGFKHRLSFGVMCCQGVLRAGAAGLKEQCDQRGAQLAPEVWVEEPFNWGLVLDFRRQSCGFLSQAESQSLGRSAFVSCPRSWSGQMKWSQARNPEPALPP